MVFFLQKQFPLDRESFTFSLDTNSASTYCIRVLYLSGGNAVSVLSSKGITGEAALVEKVVSQQKSWRPQVGTERSGLGAPRFML